MFDTSVVRSDCGLNASPKCLLLLGFQSKDIGIQMHEELVKVTNELYTVSKCVPPPPPRAPD